jgi:hypothetical protein
MPVNEVDSASVDPAVLTRLPSLGDTHRGT